MKNVLFRLRLKKTVIELRTHSHLSFNHEDILLHCNLLNITPIYEKWDLHICA